MIVATYLNKTSVSKCTKSPCFLSAKIVERRVSGMRCISKDDSRISNTVKLTPSTAIDPCFTSCLMIVCDAEI